MSTHAPNDATLDNQPPGNTDVNPQPAPESSPVTSTATTLDLSAREAAAVRAALEESRAHHARHPGDDRDPWRDDSFTWIKLKVQRSRGRPVELTGEEVEFLRLCLSAQCDVSNGPTSAAEAVLNRL